jgi:hypothetical protein
MATSDLSQSQKDVKSMLLIIEVVHVQKESSLTMG